MSKKLRVKQNKKKNKTRPALIQRLKVSQRGKPVIKDNVILRKSGLSIATKCWVLRKREDEVIDLSTI